MKGISIKGLLDNMWMIQAFQIPVVLFIIILSFSMARKRSSSGFDPGMEPLDGAQITYLRWIGCGFIFNLLYLIFHLNEHIKIIQLDVKYTPVLKITLDIFSAFAFYIASISWYYKRKLLLSKQQAKVAPINPKNLLLIGLGLITTFILAKNCRIAIANPSFDLTMDFFVYDFLSYLITGIFLLKAIEIPDAIVKRNTSKYFLSLGFLCWALLQLLKPAVLHTQGGNEVKIDIIGFGTSTLIKMSVLYGFFSFYITAARDVILKKNMALEGGSNSLKNLQKLIDEVSREDNIAGIDNLVASHLLESSVFRFDYMIFARVDYLDQKIYFQKGVSKNPKIENLDKWIPDEGLDILGYDIRALTAREKKEYYLGGNYINNKEEDLYAPQSYLDLQTYLKYDQKDLVRLFIPVMRLVNTKKLPDIDNEFNLEKVIGVLEVGYHKPVNENPILACNFQSELLKLYVDSFGQCYSRVFEEEMSKHVRSILWERDKRSHDNELQYLDILFQSTCKLIHADKGFIKIRSYNHFRLSEENITVSYDNGKITDFDFSNRSVDIIAGSKLSDNCFFVNAAVPGSGDIVPGQVDKSEFAIPILHDAKVIGVVGILSTRPDFFNEDNVYVLKSVFSEMGEVFMSKKFHNAVTQLAFNEVGLSEPEEILHPIIETIQKYFLSDYVSLWLPDYLKDKSEFKQRVSSQAIKDACGHYGVENVVLNKAMPAFEPVQVDKEILEGVLRPFKQFCTDNSIVSLVHVPLVIDKQLYGFINVYSKRRLSYLFTEDVQFLKLAANKCVISLVTSEMINSFSKVTHSLVSKPQPELLLHITSIAREILHSDPVILFLLEDDNKVIHKNTIYSGFLYEKDKIYEGKKESFIDISLEFGGDKFYKTEADLPVQYNKKNNFWRREKIKSLAVIPLRQDGHFIGVMYFNYREERAFPAAIQRLIKSFSALATTAIRNAANLELIREQRKQLAEKAEKIEFEYIDMLDKMEKMLPVANASSLAEIVRAVNHDIRNHLIKVNMNLEDIKSNHIGSIRTTSEKDALLTNIATIEADINNSTNLIRLFEPDSFKISVESVYEIIQKIRNLFHDKQRKDKAGIEVKVKPLQASVPDIRCIRAEIAMMVYNLITNSRNSIIEKWKKNGRRTNEAQGWISIELDYSHNEKCYILVVEDNGIGIDNNNMAKIYDPGFTTRPGKGMGIGLYFIKETLSTAYSGDIYCMSTVDEGAKFELKFKQHIK